MPIGGNRQIKLFAIQGTKCGQVADKIDQSVTQQRLTASEPDFFNAQLNKDPHQSQVIRKWQFGILRAFISGAAIDTLVVAAIGNGNPQIGDGAAEFVGKKQLLAPSS